MNRICVITSASGIWHLGFNSSEKKDSEALHELLTQCDPGDEYTVYFANEK